MSTGSAVCGDVTSSGTVSAPQLFASNTLTVTNTSDFSDDLFLTKNWAGWSKLQVSNNSAAPDSGPELRLLGNQSARRNLEQLRMLGAYAPPGSAPPRGAPASGARSGTAAAAEPLLGVDCRSLKKERSRALVFLPEAAHPPAEMSVLALQLHTALSFAEELPIELRDEMPLVRALGLEQRLSLYTKISNCYNIAATDPAEFVRSGNDLVLRRISSPELLLQPRRCNVTHPRFACNLPCHFCTPTFFCRRCVEVRLREFLCRSLGRTLDFFYIKI